MPSGQVVACRVVQSLSFIVLERKEKLTPKTANKKTRVVGIYVPSRNYSDAAINYVRDQRLSTHSHRSSAFGLRTAGPPKVMSRTWLVARPRRIFPTTECWLQQSNHFFEHFLLLSHLAIARLFVFFLRILPGEVKRFGADFSSK